MTPPSLASWHLSATVLLLSLTFCFSLPKIPTDPTMDPTMPPPDQMPGSMTEEHIMPHEYTRFAQVQSTCDSVLSSGIPLKFDHNRINGLKPQLSFVKGDWFQDSGHAPIMPFDLSDTKSNTSALPDPLPLTTFLLTHIDSTRNFKNALNVTGALGIGISRNGTAPEMGRYLSSEFKFWPGSSDLTITFEGVYTESDTEMVLCLVGEAMLPIRDSDPTYLWQKWLKQADTKITQSLLHQDDNIVLTLRYPKSFTLTSRAIHGQMRSLNPSSGAWYFDPVKLTSQLGAYSNYQFGSEERISTACDPYPYQDNIIESQLEVYKGSSFCGFLDRFVADQMLFVVPNWNCNSSDAYCRKLGPFMTDSTADGSFSGVSIMMQDVRCEPRDPAVTGGSYSSARVSAIFRAVSPGASQYTAAHRTGISSDTLSAEGVWNTSTGQLCMVGCLGFSGSCKSRICLYVPTSFFINRRSVILGQITSLGKERESSHYPLSFERPAHPSELWTKFTASPVTSYQYTKIKQAGALLERNEPFGFGDVIAKSLLSYPRIGDGRDKLASLSNLADDLSLHVPAVPDPRPSKRIKRPFVNLEILSLGSLLGRYWVATVQNDSPPISYKPNDMGLARESATGEQLYMNVSAELALTGEPYHNISTLYVEGLYNPVDGRMYLVGCRDVRATWKVFSENAHLEAGMDCLIEVKIAYPPTTARWLINPTAKISISSRRNEDDPLYFNTTDLQTLPILYREQREDILSRRSVEGILRILTLSLAIASIGSQLYYIKSKSTVIPYISVAMLAVQAIGYSIPLITGAEALFEKITSERDSDDPPSFNIDKGHWYWAMDYLVKLLVMFAFLLTLRLGQKVWKSRIRMLSRSPLEQWRVPNDRKVFLMCLGVHSVGFLLALLVHLINVSRWPGHQDAYVDSQGKSHKLHDLGIQLEEYIGLVQDFFLLPQIIGNYLWKIQCKPLRKAYYIGITFVRLFPHLYDCFRAPVINPYFGEEYEFVNTSSDFFSKFGDVMIPLVSVLFMVAVYVQQRWNYEKISSTVKSGQKKLLSMGSRVYERLPSMSSFEAELVASAVKDAESSGDLRKDATSQKEEI
ncbi:hypothetical protein LUZ62_086690 [Rhynchospora pubera]|uniref:RING-type E3 ubiquitin transferase n=1 Tax=Rhynchospora pubera TaxID=906938 RepID=A0AAV8C9E0_9POAL|nr:hypothetical protein LUZ62_086690 [Rhynchospora pubera]